MKYFLIPLILPILILSSCYYNNEEDLYGDLEFECDTVSVNFSSTIFPLLSENCLECHSNENAPAFGNNLVLENYQDAVNLQQAILGAIKHQPPYSPMPKNEAKLNECLIRQFEIWIENGFPEN